MFDAALLGGKAHAGVSGNISPMSLFPVGVSELSRRPWTFVRRTLSAYFCRLRWNVARVHGVEMRSNLFVFSHKDRHTVADGWREDHQEAESYWEEMLTTSLKVKPEHHITSLRVHLKHSFLKMVFPSFQVVFF